jgi:hypothetical protein
MRTHKLPLLGAICALATVASSCKDDGPVPLFEEQGTWALILFDIPESEGLENFDVGQREGEFNLHFNTEAGIVASAGCIDSMMRTDITSTLCDIDTYQCRCFEYTFEESQMLWTEFVPKGGVQPPEPPKDSMAAKPGATIAVNVEAYPEKGGTYRFSALPYGLFNSDGETSSYVFQTRGDAEFEMTGCMKYCGIEAAAAAEAGAEGE